MQYKFSLFICLGFNLFWSLSLYSQHLKITYKATAIKRTTTDAATSANLSSLAKYANNGLKSLDIIVNTDGKTNIVSFSEGLSSDFNGNNLRNLALSIALDSKKIVTDFTKKNSYYEPLLLNKIRKVSIDNLNWTIRRESKVILGYTCYKALGSIIRPGEERKLTPPMTAWFCPELSLMGGPTAYPTLPGIILELESKKIKFIAKKIDFFKNETVTLPTYDAKNVLTHKEWSDYFEANNPLSHLKN